MRSDAVANRQDLIDAGWRCIARGGVDFSLRAVAQEAGVGIATLYRHFPSRDDLILGVVGDARSRVTRAFQAHEVDWDVDPARAWAATISEIAALELGSLVEHLAPITSSSAKLSAAAPSKKEEVNALLRPIVERAHAAGLLAAEIGASELIIIIASVSRPWGSHVHASVPLLQQHLRGVLLRGLRP